MSRLRLVAGFVFVAACSAGGLVGQGGRCSTSEQCANGLLCDTSQSPAICSTTVAHRNDLAPPDDMRGVKQDLSGVTGDMSATTPDDMAEHLPDLAKHD